MRSVRFKVLLALSLLGFVSIMGASGIYQKLIGGSWTTVSLSLVQTGDTAQVMGFTPTTAVNGQLYQDTIVTNASADTCIIAWTAPGSGTTVAMVCDSMVFAANLMACSLYVTAADLTTSWKITSDDAGLAFDVILADTATDTATSTANVTSSSSTTTNNIFLGNCAGYTTLHGKIKVGAELDALSGLGDDDSVRIWLYTGRAGDQFLVDSGLYGALPCSLMVTKHSNVGDSLIRDHLEAKVWVLDTTTDTTLTVYYPFNWDITLK